MIVIDYVKPNHEIEYAATVCAEVVKLTGVTVQLHFKGYILTCEPGATARGIMGAYHKAHRS